MSWRLCTLYKPKDIDLLVVLPSPRSTSLCSPCGRSRGITTTTRPLLAVVSEDRTAGQETPKIRRTDGRLTLRRYSNVPATPSPTPPTFLNTRCANLLASDREVADANGTSNFRDRRVSVSGFIKTIRKQKHQAFADFTDGSCWRPIQVVLASKLAAPLNNGTCLRITGKWKSSPGQGQSYELEAEEVHIYGTTDIELTRAFQMVQKYPIQKKHHTPEFLRTVPHLRVRTPLNSVIARVRSSCLSFLNTWMPRLEQEGGLFVQVQPPIITTSDCEGAGEVFTVVSNAAAAPSSEQSLIPGAAPNTPPFFRAPKYLTVSAQLHLEAYAAELRNVWSMSPAFRAEKSDTPRHLAEFYMLEMELGYVSRLGALTALAESLIRSLVTDLMARPLYPELISAVRASNGDSGEEKAREVQERWNVLLGGGWKSASYTYCMKRLRAAAQQEDAGLFEREPEYGSGLQLEHERWIVENIGEGRPIFVTHYPRAIKPFYMAPSLLAEDHVLHPEYEEPAQGRPHGNTFEQGSEESGQDTTTTTVACFDLLVPFGVGEMAGGSLREHRLENLIENMRQDGILNKPNPAPPSSAPTTGRPSDIVPPKTERERTDDGHDYPFLQPGESLGSLKWYADLRRYGTMPHGGFGIGWDRLLAYLTGVHNLRDVVPFPRSFGKADC